MDIIKRLEPIKKATDLYYCEHCGKIGTRNTINGHEKYCVEMTRTKEDNDRIVKDWIAEQRAKHGIKKDA